MAATGAPNLAWGGLQTDRLVMHCLLSARPAPQTHPPNPPQLDPAQPPASYEGGEQRCFQDVYVCGRNFPLGPGLAREEEAELSPQQRSKRLAETVPLEPWTYGQAVVAWHQQAGAAARRMRRRPRPPPALQDGISLLEAAEAAAAAGPAPAVARARSSGGRLRVLVIKRGGEGRQILNAPELLRRCNAWRYQPPGGGPAVTAECSEVGACRLGRVGTGPPVTGCFQQAACADLRP